MLEFFLELVCNCYGVDRLRRLRRWGIKKHELVRMPAPADAVRGGAHDLPRIDLLRPVGGVDLS